MNLRRQHLERLSSTTLDVLIIGGGINGAVSAAALAARGVKVGLIDARDFAGFTSQQSSNLIWGGIKYLESYEFSLVSKLCKARNTLLEHYPSVVQEIRFLTSIPKSFRRHPRLVWAGAWLYWLMGRGFTKTPKYLSTDKLGREEPAINTSLCKGGIEYSDAYLHDNDARFVFNFIRSAVDKGCLAANYLEATKAKRNADGLWSIQAEDQAGGRELTIRARSIINAAGAFVDEFNAANDIKTRYKHIFSKGIHLIVPSITQSKRVLAFFADDGRLFFAIPMGNRTCIGTTDTPVSDPNSPVSEEDRDFVLDNINARLNLNRPLSRDDIIAERCGVRPLAVKHQTETAAAADFLNLSRKHVIECDVEQAYMSIFGGKLTDCLNVGEEICRKLADFGIEASSNAQRNEACWYGEPAAEQYARYAERVRQASLDATSLTDSGETLSERLWRRYGMDAFEMLDQIEQDPAQAQAVIDGAALYRCELRHLAEKEMIVSLQDLLHRRTKIDLVVSREILFASQGTMEICRSVFGDLAQAKFDEYFNQ